MSQTKLYYSLAKAQQSRLHELPLDQAGDIALIAVSLYVRAGCSQLARYIASEWVERVPEPSKGGLRAFLQLEEMLETP